MKLVALQENLKTAVALTSHFTSPKAQLPILGNILLKAEKSKLYLSSTNLEISVKTSIAVKVEEEGEIAVNGKTLNDIVSNLNSESIELESVQENFRIVSGKFKSNLLGSNTSDFPSLPTQTGKNSFKLNRDDLINSLSKVLFSVSTDETRPILTGVLFLIKDKSLRLVSTDGFRLSEVKLKGEIDTDNLKLVIPKTVLYELTKIAVDSDYIEVSFDSESNQVMFMIGDTILSSRVIEGEFPDYEKIIPQSSITSIFIDKKDFEKSIKLASVFARESGKTVRLKIMENKMVVSAESSNSGNQEMDIEIRHEDVSILQNEINIMFNFSFIEDVLKVIIDDEVKIIFAVDNKASKFIDSKSLNYLHIIMPIKTN